VLAAGQADRVNALWSVGKSGSDPAQRHEAGTRRGDLSSAKPAPQGAVGIAVLQGGKEVNLMGSCRPGASRDGLEPVVAVGLVPKCVAHERLLAAQCAPGIAAPQGSPAARRAVVEQAVDAAETALDLFGNEAYTTYLMC
jgi:hypothetical protein